MKPKAVTTVGFELHDVPILPVEALPHRAAIQRSFGTAHDLSSIRTRVGGSATSEAQARGAEAFAQGESISFARPPALELAAHEAAHVIQQRRGGAPAGQEAAWEGHADAVAAEVVAGRSAGHLFSILPAHRPVVQTQLRPTRGGDNSQLVPRINQVLSPGSTTGLRIFLAGFLPVWPQTYDGFLVPQREPAISNEPPAATLMGMVTGTRRLSRVQGNQLITIVAPSVSATTQPAQPTAGRRGGAST